MDEKEALRRPHNIVFPFDKVDDPKIELPDWLKSYRGGGANFRESWGLSKQPPYHHIPNARRGVISFFQTVANPRADEALRKSPLAKKYYNEMDWSLDFSTDLMDLCLTAVSKRARLEEIPHHQYARVDSSGGIGNVVGSFLVNWPIVHAVIGGAETTRHYTGFLEDVWKHVDFKPKPNDMHNKILAEKIDLLKDKEIPPLKIVGRDFMLTADQLKVQGQPFELYLFQYHSEMFDPSSED